MTKSHKVTPVLKQPLLIVIFSALLLLPVSNAFSAREPLPGEILDQDGIAYRLEGRRFQSAGDLVSAAAAYQKAVMTSPNYAEAYNDLGVVLESMGNRDKAEEAYLTALHLKPELGDPHMNLALLYEDAGDIKKAGDHWRARVRIGPPEDPWVLKAHEKMIQHGLITAPAITAVNDSNPSPVFSGDRAQEVRRALQAGQAHLEAKRYDLAIHEFQTALALDPTNPKAIHWLREAEQQAYSHQVKESKKYDDAHRSVRSELKGIQKQEEHAPTEPSLPAGSNIVVPKAVKTQPKTNIQPVMKKAAAPKPVPVSKKKKTADQAMEEALIRAQSQVEPVRVKKPAEKAPSDAASLAKELANQKAQVRQKSSRELSQRATQVMRESRYAEAADLYKQILLLEPNSREAQQGLQRAQKAQARAEQGGR